MPADTSRADEQSLSLRERGKRRRAERILDAGLELLREAPGESLTVERIAARAGVSPMTVFNLVGNREQLWSAMADRALRALDLDTITADSPQDRARKIVDSVVRLLRSDAVVFRELLVGWGHGGRILAQDPTGALLRCLQDEAAAGTISSEVDLRRHGEVMGAGLFGVIGQWTAGLISDPTFAGRARAVVDIVFAAARSAG